MENLKPIETKPASTGARDANGIEKTYKKAKDNSRKITRGITDNLSIFAAIAIIVVAILVFFTELELDNLFNFTKIGLTFGILWLCSYLMYITMIESGKKAGNDNSDYNKALVNNEKYSNALEASNNYGGLSTFCNHYIEDELKQTRNNILRSSGIDYVNYQKEYIDKSKKELRNQYIGLSKGQIKSIILANKQKAIRLTPEMITRGAEVNRRNPIRTEPKTKLDVKKGMTAFSSIIVTGFLAITVLEIIISPTFATFAACMLKLLSIIWSGFKGFMTGYKHIVEDTTGYINDQNELLKNANAWLTAHPEVEQEVIKKVEKEAENKTVPTQAEQNLSEQIT